MFLNPSNERLTQSKRLTQDRRLLYLRSLSSFLFDGQMTWICNSAIGKFWNLKQQHNQWRKVPCKLRSKVSWGLWKFSFEPVELFTRWVIHQSIWNRPEAWLMVFLRICLFTFKAFQSFENMGLYENYPPIKRAIRDGAIHEMGLYMGLNNSWLL